MWGELYPGIGQPLAAQFQITPENGTISVDSTNAQRWSLSSLRSQPQTTLYPEGLPVPLSSADALFPDGAEIVVWKGVRYAGGPMLLPFDFGMGEAVPCGRLLVDDVEVVDSLSTPGEFYFMLNAVDRGGTLDRAGFTAPYSTNGTSTLDVVVRSLLSSLQVVNIAALPTLFIPDPVHGFPVPAQATYSIGTSPFSSAIMQLCAGVGFEAFFDRFGALIVQPVPDPSTIKPVASFSEGEDILISAQAGLNTQGVPNVIYAIAQGSNVGAPLQGVWWDSNPDSPTYYGPAPPPAAPAGTYPTTVKTVSSAVATSQADINRVAQSAGLASLGSMNTMQFKIIDCAALDVEDVVSLTRAQAGIVNENFSLDKLTIQLGIATALQCVGRGVYA